MKYEIGQEVWWARFENTESSIECPDCAGLGHIRCIRGDGTEVTVDCQNCHVGLFSSGRIKTYDRRPAAVRTQIIGMELRLDEGVLYRVPASYSVEEANLFETETEALHRAVELATEASHMELKQIAQKEKNTFSWAWNATYHRRCIRQAQRQIEYHTRKLDVAGERARAELKRKA